MQCHSTDFPNVPCPNVFPSWYLPTLRTDLLGLEPLADAEDWPAEAPAPGAEAAATEGTGAIEAVPAWLLACCGERVVCVLRMGEPSGVGGFDWPATARARGGFAGDTPTDDCGGNGCAGVDMVESTAAPVCMPLVE
jgi:hypothetical protein